VAKERVQVLLVRESKRRKNLELAGLEENVAIELAEVTDGTVGRRRDGVFEEGHPEAMSSLCSPPG